MNKATNIIYILFVSAFIVHISFIGNKVFTELPNLQVFKKQLKDIEFPLIFRVCANQVQNGDAKFQKYGYRNFDDFFRGKSMFNQSLFGWGGHMSNGLNKANVEGKLTKKA